LDLGDIVRRRRMVRAFTPEPVDPAVVDDLIDLARRAPSAGNSQGMAYLVLEGADTAVYWDVSLPVERRPAFGWPGLVDAPVLIVVLVRPSAWVERYSEPDKAAAGLGEAADAWPVPYWWVDAGLGACFFGPFGHEAEVTAALGVPDGWRVVGIVALGHPAPDRPGLSAGRPRPPLDEVLHRGAW
jgi:nitroreductase